MGIDLLPKAIQDKYEVHEWKHACAILAQDFPSEWNDILAVLEEFKLFQSQILARGGRKSPIAARLDSSFYELGWEEKAFETSIQVENALTQVPTHSVDCFKNKVGIEVEWNNKDPFYDRDLNNFRLLFDLRVLSVGVVITRSDELQLIFNRLGKGSSYGASTTHISKLLPRLHGGGAGGCPVLVFGITEKCYEEDVENG